MIVKMKPFTLRCRISPELARSMELDRQIDAVMLKRAVAESKAHVDAAFERRQDMTTVRRVELVENVGGHGRRTGSGLWSDHDDGGWAVMTWKEHEEREQKIAELEEEIKGWKGSLLDLAAATDGHEVSDD